MHTVALAAETYRRTLIESRSPLELVLLLYDGAANAVRLARQAIERDDGHAKRAAIARALEIVNELQNVLDLEAGGEVAASLDALYSFVAYRLIEANQQDSVAALDEAVRVLTPLHEAWRELTQSPAAAGGSP